MADRSFRKVMLRVSMQNEGELPNRILIAKPGRNESSKGVYIYDPSRRSEMQARYAAEDGRDRINIDVDHMSLSEAASIELREAVGWFVLDYAEDGIWANDIEWTPKGAELIRNRSFRFISPVLYLEDDGETIESVLNFALTNTPATIGIEPFIASRRNKTKMTDTQDESTDQAGNQAPDAMEHAEDSATGDAGGTQPEMTPEEMASAIAALKDQVNQLTAENEDLRKQLDAAKAEDAGEPADPQANSTDPREAIAAALSKDGFLKPSQVEWAKSLPLKQLTAFDKAQRSNPANAIAFGRKFGESRVTPLASSQAESNRAGSVYQLFRGNKKSPSKETK